MAGERLMELLDELTSIVGASAVLTGQDCDAYAADWTGSYNARPMAVVKPATTAQVSAVLALANRTRTPVVTRSGNTGLVGGGFAPDRLVVSMERMNQIIEIRPESRVAIVQAGVVLSKIHDAVDGYDLVFPLFFGARGSAMIGGNLATNAGGSNVLRYGNTRAQCLGIEVVLADGRIMNLMSTLNKDNSGYDLKNLFIGSEGTLGIITAAVLKLHPKPGAYATAMVAASSIESALTLLNRLQRETGGAVEAFEFMPRNYLTQLKKVLPHLKPPLGYDQDVTILVEVGALSARESTVTDDGTVPITDLLESVLMEMIKDGLASDAVIARSGQQRLDMWKIRESAAEIGVGRSHIIESDVALPLDKVAEFLETATERLTALDPKADTMTVCHLGDGNVHFTIWPQVTDPQLHDQIREMVEDVTEKLDGSFSAEHGIGLSKLNSMARRKDSVALAVMKDIKSTLDPNNIMNPGKVLPGD